MLLLFVASFSFAQNADLITFEKRTQKFKKVDEGQLVELSYIFNYSGNETLSITPPDLDCSCTTVILPEGKISPNSTNSIKITFDTKDKIGYQERAIHLEFVSNTAENMLIKKKIVFKGVVKASEATKKAYKLSKKKR